MSRLVAIKKRPVQSQANPADLLEMPMANTAGNNLSSSSERPSGQTLIDMLKEHLLFLVPFALLLVFYAPVLYGLTFDWYDDPNYSHGFLVPLVSAFLLWQKRKELLSAVSEVDYRGLILVIGGQLLFLVANGAAEYFTLRLSFIITLFGLVWLLYGRRTVALSWFEFGFLVFMIPIPYVIYYAATFPMQTLAAKATVGALKAIGMGAVRQGNIIHLQGTSLEVAEACSGLRSLVSLLALGALYSYMTQKTLLPRALLFASTVPIAIAGNVFRVFVTSLLVYTVSADITDEPLHSLMGLSVFVVAFLMLGVLGYIFRRVFR